MRNKPSPARLLRGRRKENLKGGFSLLELLIASFLMASLIALVLYLWSGVLRSWNKVSENLSSDYKARLALSYLISDLESAFFENDGHIWFIMEKDEGEGMEDSVWVRFFTAAADQKGGINAVSYRLEYLNPLQPGDAKGKVPALYRSAVEGEKTFREFLGRLEEKEKGDFLDRTSPLAVSESYLSGNIVSFSVDLWMRGADSDPESPAAIRIAEGGRIAFPMEEDSRKISQPLFADISLTFLSEEGMRLLEALEEGVDLKMNRKEIIEQYGTPYLERVNFRSSAL